MVYNEQDASTDAECQIPCLCLQRCCPTLLGSSEKADVQVTSLLAEGFRMDAEICVRLVPGFMMLHKLLDLRHCSQCSDVAVTSPHQFAFTWQSSTVCTGSSHFPRNEEQADTRYIIGSRGPCASCFTLEMNMWRKSQDNPIIQEVWNS